jgi:hypothetical protein
MVVVVYSIGPIILPRRNPIGSIVKNPNCKYSTPYRIKPRLVVFNGVIRNRRRRK